jgi:DNA-binding MarR family transcriptional regulator
MVKKQENKSAGFEVCFNLSFRKATRVISQIYDRELADCGIKCTQFTLLRAIKHLDETTNAELQKRLVLDQTTLSRGLKPLIRDGLIQALPGQDKRQKILSLTPTGKDLYQQGMKGWRRAQKAMRKELGEDITEQMLTMNSALVALRH